MLSEKIQSHGGLSVGDPVRVPGHGRNDPPSFGKVEEITRMDFPRGAGYFVTVRRNDGSPVTTALGLCRKVTT